MQGICISSLACNKRCYKRKTIDGKLSLVPGPLKAPQHCSKARARVDIVIGQEPHEDGLKIERECHAIDPSWRSVVGVRMRAGLFGGGLQGLGLFIGQCRCSKAYHVLMILIVDQRDSYHSVFSVAREDNAAQHMSLRNLDPLIWCSCRGKTTVDTWKIVP
eukprot:437866-Pelagomonas_calceolata.AAC.3